MFQWNAVWQYLVGDRAHLFLVAAWNTLWISVVAQVAGTIIGTFLAMMLLSRHRWVRFPADFYVWFFRGSPLLIQVMILFYGFPILFQGNTFVNNLLNSYTCVLVAFSLNEGAYMAEIIRAGIQSVDKGQMEAARALGMNTWLAMRRVIFPQAARVIIPPLGNEFNNMLKNTSLASVIFIIELTGASRYYSAASSTALELMLVATVYYLLFTTLWGFMQAWMEDKLNVEEIREHRVSWWQRAFGLTADPSSGH